MQASKLLIAFLIALIALLSIVTAIDVRNLSDSPSVAIGRLPIAAVVGIAAAAAVAVMVSVAIKVRNVIRLKDLELHEVVISPNQPAEQPLSVTKQFVYTAHI
ncbi:unnamed protein product [Peronospora destructor]|uniref:Uncharacterized protein n=1 Tax=Peronospora destructor TaxID=86335 RepID=A0AAV0V2Z2_9STRA|nr:unnamed protein product [Peronospora destructor]